MSHNVKKVSKSEAEGCTGFDANGEGASQTGTYSYTVPGDAQAGSTTGFVCTVPGHCQGQTGQRVVITGTQIVF